MTSETDALKNLRREYNGREYGFLISEDSVQIRYQPINKKTGKPWQAYRYVEKFEGEGMRYRAFLRFMKIIRGE